MRARIIGDISNIFLEKQLNHILEKVDEEEIYDIQVDLKEHQALIIFK